MIAAMRVTVIGNQAAGPGCPDWRRIESGLQARGLQARIELPGGGEDILAVADRALREGADIVVAAGGDGTVSAVASRLAGTATRLGVLPVGTLNHFAKDLGIPLDLDAAMDVIAGGSSIAVDVGEVNGRLFVNNSSIGLYPLMVIDRERLRKAAGRNKWLAMLSASWHVLRRYRALDVTIDIEGERQRHRTPLVFVGNNRYVIEGVAAGKRSSLQDGLLSLHMTRDVGRWGLIRLAARAMTGRLHDDDTLVVRECEWLEIHCRHKRLHVALDGEVVRMPVPLRYRVRPADLQVMVPGAPDPQPAP